ncbi:MAG: Sugar fermentation stimulation protein [Clostridiales bacterium]|jgi:hypothetical protein|nr:Sugar fermentation stimulation protein [Clostridiales bacterium]
MNTKKDKSENKDKVAVTIKAIIIVLLALSCILAATVVINDGKIPEVLVPSDQVGVNNLDVHIDLSYYDQAPQVAQNLYEKAFKVKGVYVNPSAVSSTTRLDNLINLANTTEINSFVIDIKDDNGKIAFDMDLEKVNAIGAEVNNIKDINALMDKLYANNIYPIARIVCFKDPFTPFQVQDIAIKTANNAAWSSGGKNPYGWLNPYEKGSWEYILNIAKECAKVGFREIQFDYVRFDTGQATSTMVYGGESDTISKMDIILQFLQYAKDELEPLNVDLSADVFGIVILSDKDAARIGQNYLEICKVIDVISPMVYPSHYGKGGYYGTDKEIHSDHFPYEIIYGSMKQSGEKLSEVSKDVKVATVRPWLQAFTASYLKGNNYIDYGPEEIRAQIQGTYDAGYEEWILWNSGSQFDIFVDGLESN